jgi:MFS family permease
MTIFTLFALRNLSKLPAGTYRKIDPKAEVMEFIKTKSIRTIGAINVLLQLFYTFMVIYVPIYLTEVIGFSWSELGLILCIALIPFVLLDSPVGELADKKYGEKEFLIIGFSILSVTSAAIAFVDSTNLLVWAGLLFLSRVGASLTDVSSETYFFKKAQGRDELIGIYKIGTPLAFMIGPLIGSLVITIFPFNYVFVILGIILLAGVYLASRLKDTR